MAHRRRLRTSTRLAALLGAAALSTMVSGVAYAATQPPQPLVHLQVGLAVQETTSPDPTAEPTITDSPTPTAEPTVTITQTTIPDLPTSQPTPPGNGGAGGGAGTESNKNTAKPGNAKKPVRTATTSNDESLPLTGSNTSNLIVLGGLLTVGGVGLIATARRRRTN
jgi:LPXTG-motif cell wall-anchored protein